MPISVVFDPPLPSDSPSTFNTKAFTLLGDLNDWSTEANALPAELAIDLVAERSATATLTNKTLTSPDINGGTIDGAAIGSTTPAAGSFTTLSASGVTTLSGGTIVNNGSGIVNPGAFQGSMFHHANYLQFAGGTTGTAFNNHANTVANLTIADAGAVTIPGSATVGKLLTTSATSDTVHAGGSMCISSSTRVSLREGTAYDFNVDSYNNGSPLSVLNITAGGAVTIPGSVGIGVTPSASVGGGRELTVYGGVSIRGDSRYWYIDGKAGQDAIVIGLRASGDTVDTDAINIDSAGAVTIPGSLSLTGGTFGYGTGAGVTAIQTTSKSNPVTANKPSGQITMHNAALASGASVAVFITNSYCTATSTVVVSMLEDGATSLESYLVQAAPYGSGGAFFLLVKNISGGSLSDALKVRFAVISGANA